MSCTVQYNIIVRVTSVIMKRVSLFSTSDSSELNGVSPAYEWSVCRSRSECQRCSTCSAVHVTIVTAVNAVHQDTLYTAFTISYWYSSPQTLLHSLLSLQYRRFSSYTPAFTAVTEVLTLFTTDTPESINCIHLECCVHYHAHSLQCGHSKPETGWDGWMLSHFSCFLIPDSVMLVSGTFWTSRTLWTN